MKTSTVLAVVPPSRPLSSSQALADYFGDLATPEGLSPIHCGVEGFPFRLTTNEPVGYEEDHGGLLDLFAQMEADGWAPIMDENVLIGVRRGFSTVTMQAGSQLRLSSTASASLHQAATGLEAILGEINTVGETMDIGLLGMGYHPTARREAIPEPPGARYRVAQETLARRKDSSLDALQRSCEARVIVGYTSETDMVKKFRVALALQPVLTALFANSPFAEGHITDYKSARMAARTRIADGMNRLIHLAFDAAFGYETYARWASEQPLIFARNKGRIHDANGQSFRSFMEGKLTCLPGVTPTSDDWLFHLKNLFSDVNLSVGVTLRGADAGPSEMMLALTAFWTGILYDKTSLDNAWELVKSWQADDICRLRQEAPRLGLASEIYGLKMHEIAHLAVKLAMRGLQRRALRTNNGPDETRYLQVLFDYSESRMNRADLFKLQHDHFPDFSVYSVFKACRLMGSAPVNRGFAQARLA